MRVRASLPEYLERLLVSLWAGGLWVSGFVAAPVLFRVAPDRVTAGRFAGALFEAVGWLGLACGVALLVLRWVRSVPHRRAALTAVVAMLAITAVGQFVLHPELSAIRDTLGALEPGTPSHARFAFLHRVSGGLFLLNSVLAAVLIWLGLPPRR